MYLYIKALHVIFVITWFSGLFYIVRLFVYQIENNSTENHYDRNILSRQLSKMARRLWYIITWPSMILASSFAIILLILNPKILNQSWMQVKLAFVVILILYHLYCQVIFTHLQNGNFRYSSHFMRLYNEGPTLILFSVIFLVTLRNSIHWLYGVIGMMLLGIFLMLGIRFYKNRRDKL